MHILATLKDTVLDTIRDDGASQLKIGALLSLHLVVFLTVAALIGYDLSFPTAYIMACVSITVDKVYSDGKAKKSPLVTD